MNRERLNLIAGVPTHESLKRIAADNFDGNKSEAVRTAVRVFDEIVKAQASGGRVVLVGPDGKQREVIFVL